MSRPIVAVHTLHFEERYVLKRTGRPVLAAILSTQARPCVSVFDPGYRLPRGIRGDEMDLNTWSKVRTVDSGYPISADQHEKNGLRASIGLIFCILCENPKPHPSKFLRPVAVLTCLARRHKTVACEPRRNRLWAGF